MEEKIIYKNQKRVSDKDLILSYKLTGNVWKTGEKVGLSGQSVHQRLTKLGVINKMNYFTENDNEYLRQHYVSYRNSEDLKSLAIILNRTVPFINRKAKELGLTNKDKSDVIISNEKRRKQSEVMKNRITINGHPRYMKGKKHTEKTKNIISINIKKMWKDPNSKVNSDEYKQKASDRMAKMQSEGKLTNNYTRTKHGTVTIGGKTNFFRSSWEVNIAAYFEFLKSKNEIKEWEYEPHVFWFENIKRGIRSYKPDFRITNNDDTQYYVEVKGWMDDKSKTKIKRMKKYYPSVKLDVIDSKRYRQISKWSKIIPNWGCLETEKEDFIKCSVEGCENKSHCKNLCRSHFYKVYKK